MKDQLPVSKRAFELVCGSVPEFEEILSRSADHARDALSATVEALTFNQ
jgi:hypothetical protein